ncbi:MAG: UMP kinase [Bacteroidetes bacterium]|nr:UMP kinase [Bacteroidota bacterium]
MKFKRVLLKLSGEALQGDQGYGIDHERLAVYARDIKSVVEKGVQVGIVIGGGNIFRGLVGTASGVDRVRGDYMGMLATVINSLAIQNALEGEGIPTVLFSGIRIEPFTETPSGHKMILALESGKVVIIGGGTGNPFFTTDTAAALRAVEMNADAILKGTRVDGIYTADPEKDPSAKKYDAITYSEAMQKKLNVMDMTAFALCEDNKLPIVVFDMNKPGNLMKIIDDQSIGTLVS